MGTHQLTLTDEELNLLVAALDHAANALGHDAAKQPDAYTDAGRARIETWSDLATRLVELEGTPVEQPALESHPEARASSDVYVLTAERDHYDEAAADLRPICFEQYLDAASLDDARAFKRSLGDRYGRTRIARLVFVDEEAAPARPSNADITRLAAVFTTDRP